MINFEQIEKVEPVTKFLEEEERKDKIFQHVNFHVKEFRKAMGLPMHSVKPNDKLHLSLFNEEAGELAEAKKQNNSGAYVKRDLADALADLAVVSVGWHLDGFPPFEIREFVFALHKYARTKGINFSGAFDIVHESNMSKLCSDSESMNLTAKKYENEGVKVEFINTLGENHACLCAKDVTLKGGKEIKKGKLLKSIEYVEPDWSERERWLITKSK